MRISFLGSRGIPARYSGFETFYEQLAVRLAARGHEVTVYNRSRFMGDVGREYRGVRIVSLPSVPTKHLDTITHTALSTAHLMLSRCDIAYYCIVGNSPLVWLPRLRGIPTVLNVDAADWAREKWGAFARWYQRTCERVATRTATILVADSRVIKERYKTLYGTDSVYVPYGANVQRVKSKATLEKHGLTPRGYFMYVGRLVPENAVHLLLDAYRGVDTRLKLVIVGDAPFADEYKADLKRRADERVVFTGYAFGSDYAELSSHAYASVQPSAIEGTRPALLDQLGFGNCVIARGSAANAEVISDAGILYDPASPVDGLRVALARAAGDAGLVNGKRSLATGRIDKFFNWEWITDFHEEMFRRLHAGRAVPDYDGYLAERKQSR